MTKKEYIQQYQGEHKDEYNAYAREYYRKNRERINARRNTVEQKQARRLRVNARRNKIRIELLNMFGGKCIKCGFSDWRALQIDHINGGGSKERKIIRDTWKYMRIIIQDKNREEKYQLLCSNCNWIKRYENYEERKAIK